ncbi:unnamed protein product [Adineta ricciae]|uniref:Uncharacterized protein n=1 Tax=Adineta ricciae TaxID=249248 RepID=A0A814W896_ADIRI|nr:unnamed protein product [Adineta ricciae]
MVTNPHVQSRVKHYEILLSREVVLLERQREQNLTTLKKLEQTIRHEKERHSAKNQQNRNAHILERSQNTRMHGSNEKASPFVPKFRRLCTKAHRLPPITKSCIPSTEQRLTNDRVRHLDNETIDKENEDLHDLLLTITNQLAKHSALETTKVDKQVHSFIEALPEYKGVQQGFDSFAPSSLYSTHATVAMR